jgi:hypothetical protein
MKKIFIFMMFFSIMLYPAGLKSGFYSAEYDYPENSDETYFREKLVPCEELSKNTIMRRYKCGNLKIFKDGKTVFVQIKNYMDTGNFIHMNRGTYLAELREGKNGIYQGKNDFIVFYIKEISNNELELTVISRIKYSSTEFPMRGGAYVPGESDRLTFKYKGKITANDESEALESAASFETAAEDMGISYGNYKKLENGVYYADKKIENADFDSFDVYKNNNYLSFVFSDYAKDKKNIYYAGKVLKNADYNTFEFMGENYSKDKNNIYYNGEKIKGADIETFEIINWAYSKDKKYVYLKGEIVKGENPHKFKLR